VSFFVSGQPLGKRGQINDSTDTTIYTAEKRTTLIGMAFTENEGGTPTLRVWLEDEDGTEVDIRSTLAVTARQRVVIDEVLVLAIGDTVHVQSSDETGAFDWTLTYIAPDAAVGGGRK
jgi:hypothetical protein